MAINFDKIKKKALAFLRKNKLAIIGLKTGFGKTNICIEYLKDNKKINSSLILVPKSILLQWYKSFVKYKFTIVASCTGKYFEFRNPKNKSTIMLATHSVMPVYSKLNVFDDRVFDCVVIDEPKLLKSTSQFFEFMCSIFSDTKYKILLDATIIENDYSELGILACWFGVTVDELRRITFAPKLPAYRKIVRKLIKVKPLPSSKSFLRYIEYNLYHALKDRNIVATKYEIQKLKRFFGSVEFETDIGYQKIRALLDVLRGDKELRGIIFCETRAAMEVIHAEFIRAGYNVCCFHGGLKSEERREIAEAFAHRKLDWIVSTKAGERGLDLWSGNCVVHYTLPWSGSSYVQRDRVTRRSSDLEATTVIYTLITDDSAEEFLRRLVIEKVKKDISWKFSTKLQRVEKSKWITYLEGRIKNGNS